MKWAPFPHLAHERTARHPGKKEPRAIGGKDYISPGEPSSKWRSAVRCQTSPEEGRDRHEKKKKQQQECEEGSFLMRMTCNHYRLPSVAAHLHQHPCSTFVLAGFLSCLFFGAVERNIECRTRLEAVDLSCLRCLCREI